MNATARLTSFRNDLGPAVWRSFVLSVLTGILWFSVETFFVYVLQAFMVSLHFVPIENTLVGKFPFIVNHALSALLLFGVLRAIAGFLKSFTVNLTYYRFIAEQRKYLFEIGLRSAHLRGGNDVASLFGDITTNASLLMQYLCLLFCGLFSSFLFFAFGLLLAPVEMMIGILLLLLFVYPFRKLGQKMKKAGEGISKEWAHVNGSLLSGLRNHFLLRVYRRTDQEIADANLRIDAYARHGIDNARAFSILSVYPLLVGITVLTILTMVAQKITMTSPAVLVSFFYIFIRLSQSASEASANYSLARFYWPAFKILMSTTRSRGNYVAETSTSRSTVTRVHSLKFDGVTFGFDAARTLFTNLSFELGEGQRLAIVGESGSGKSTLLTLIFGLIKPVQGRILVNDQPLAELGTSYYESIGYVGPEPFVTERSVRDNLLFGHPSPEAVLDDRLWEALRVSELEKEIRAFPEGLDYQLKEAHRLSTGQKQRVSIARAFLRRPSLFIFDEGTGNLDQKTEKTVIANLRAALGQTLFIFVTHRAELALASDQVVSLTV